MTNPDKATAVKWVHGHIDHMFYLLNGSIPAFAVNEWIVVRQKLAILHRLTHPANESIFTPTPATFGTASYMRCLADEVSGMCTYVQAAGFANNDQIRLQLTWLHDALRGLLNVFQERQEQAAELGQQVPLFVPTGLVPAMNHFSTWAEGDRSIDSQSWLAAPPQPTLQFNNF